MVHLIAGIVEVAHPGIAQTHGELDTINADAELQLRLEEEVGSLVVHIAVFHDGTVGVVAVVFEIGQEGTCLEPEGNIHRAEIAPTDIEMQNDSACQTS